jgi:predicted membrane protein
MDTQENTSPSNQSGRAWGGLIIVAVGAVLLAKKAGADLPPWLFTWQMALITFGVFVGAKHRFRDWGWLVPVAIGSVFLADKFIEDISIEQFFWPIIIIFIGLIMIFKPKRSRDGVWRRWNEKHQEQFSAMNSQNTEEDFINAVTIFGGAKKVIISKDFKGGETTTFFGGVEINLTQADINGRAELELTQVFGGTKLVVPSNWKIQTEELVSVFGGLDDKRKNITTPDPDKTLVLKGTCIFGGIDIKNY